MLGLKKKKKREKEREFSPHYLLWYLFAIAYLSKQMCKSKYINLEMCFLKNIQRIAVLKIGNLNKTIINEYHFPQLHPFQTACYELRQVTKYLWAPDCSKSEIIIPNAQSLWKY